MAEAEISEADVIACYKYLLGREPESEEAIKWHMGHNSSLQEMVNGFVKSDEFFGRFGIFPTGRFLDADKFNVRIDANDRMMQALLTRTATTWRELGEKEPHWSVLTDPDFLADKIDSNLEQFYATGEYEIGRVKALLERNNLSFAYTGTALDFGCGVGRLTLPLSRHFAHAIGVDISKAHIEQAERAAKHFKIENASFQDIDAVEDIENLPKCDFLLSLIVLQHNPPPVILAILQKLLDRLERRGVAVFQVPIFQANYEFTTEAYLRRPRSDDMEMHPLPPRFIFKAIADAGCSVLEVREDLHAYMPHIVSQTFLVQRT